MSGVDCGPQAIICDYPIRFDTYTGCSHGCRYCFAQTKVNLNDIVAKNCAKQLANFIEGKRSQTTKWCDWRIPLHWGGLSDPFQPAEKEAGVSLRCLEIFKRTQYPVIISTKGKLLCTEPYLSLLRECNAVVQVSMLCSSYDKLEPGAPIYEERLQMVRILSANSKRVIVRAQPYMLEIQREFLENVPRLKEAGAYGLTIEGMKFKRKKPGLVKVCGDFCYPEQALKPHYEEIRESCRENDLTFFCAENRLRGMGDSLSCCGCGDLPGFKGNSFNVSHLLNGDPAQPTERMKQPGTGAPFKAINQCAGAYRPTTDKPFASHIISHYKKEAK